MSLCVDWKKNHFQHTHTHKKIPWWNAVGFILCFVQWSTRFIFIILFHSFPCGSAVLSAQTFFFCLCTGLYIYFCWALQRSQCRKWKSNGCAFIVGHYCLPKCMHAHCFFFRSIYTGTAATFLHFEWYFSYFTSFLCEWNSMEFDKVITSFTWNNQNTLS